MNKSLTNCVIYRSSNRCKWKTFHTPPFPQGFFGFVSDKDVEAEEAFEADYKKKIQFRYLKNQLQVLEGEGLLDEVPKDSRGHRLEAATYRLLESDMIKFFGGE